MFIEKIFSPKWKHKNPTVRKQALQVLNPLKQETQKIFAEVLKIDSDVGIRRLVVRRLTDLNVLQDIRNNLSDLADDATKRLCQLFAGKAQYPIAFEQRLSGFADISEQYIVEYVAREAQEPQLRLAAVEKIERQALLGDLAVNDADQDVRLKALEKINQTSTLERVYKNSRLKDKRVSAIAQERLDVIKTEQERPLLLMKDAKQRCLELETLVRSCQKSGQWIKVASQFEKITQAWQAIRDQWQPSYDDWDQGLTDNFNALSQEFSQEQKNEQQQREKQRQLEEKTEPYKAQKRRICESLQAEIATLKQWSQPSQEQLQAVEEFNNRCSKEWSQAEEALLKEDTRYKQGVAGHEELDNQYYSLSNELADYIRDMRAYLSADQRLQELLNKSRKLIESEEFLESRQVESIERAEENIKPPKYFALSASQQAELKSLISKLHDKIEELQRLKQQHLEEFTQLVSELEDAVKSGKSKHATNLANRGRKILGLLPEPERRKLQKNKLQNRFQSAIAALGELQAWKKWSNAPIKEQLCKDMQALAEEVEANKDNAEFDFHDVGQRVKQARAEWKKLTTAEPSPAKELWEAFDTACTQAYAPCQEYFGQQAQQRSQNLEQRAQVCKSLEDYYEVLSHKPSDLVDWKALDKIIKVAEQEWRQLGLVDRKDKATINKRFRDIVNALRKVDLNYKQSNKEEKQQLISRAEAIVAQLEEEKIDLREAIEKAKQLQAEWKNIGVAVKDGELWKKFRSSCDAVFAKRDEQNAAVAEQRQKIIDAKVEICRQIEQLASLHGEELKAAQKDFEQLKQQWRDTPAPPKQNNLDKQFRSACKLFEAQNQQRIKDEQLQRMQTQQQQSALSQQAEQVLFDAVEQNNTLEQCQQRMAELESQWQSLPQYNDALSQTLQKRFSQATAWLQQAQSHGVDEVKATLNNNEHSVKTAKEQLCLQMEILANVESPLEAQQARMEYQVAQLADKMKQQDAEDRLEKAQQLHIQWHLSGIVAPELSLKLEQRFDKAVKAITLDVQ